MSSVKQLLATTLISASMLVGGCMDTTFCDLRGYTLAIDNPPAEITEYTFTIEFEDQEVEIDCSGVCEVTQGPWTVGVAVSQRPPSSYPSYVGIVDERDQFTSRIPHGEIRVVLTSREQPEFFAEHVSQPQIMNQSGSRQCEWAEELWDLQVR